MPEPFVRKATDADAQRIVEMGKRSLEIGPYKDEIGDNTEVTLRLFKLLLDNPQAEILVLDAGDGQAVGLFAMLLFPHYFSGEKTAQELMWYVEPEHRAGGAGLQLLRQAEEMARGTGATRFQLTAPTEALGSLYKRCGYHQIEVGYQRKL